MHIEDLHPRRFFLDTWREIDGQATHYRATTDRPGSDALLTVYIFSVVGISLILQEYFGDNMTFERIVRFIDSPLSPEAHPFLYALLGWIKPGTGRLWWTIQDEGYGELWMLGYWASWRVFGFLVLPVLAVAVHPRLHFRELGLSFAGMRRHLWLYGVLFVPVFVAVFIVSFTEDFSTYYPFYTNAHRSFFDFAIWELFYIAQFFALELFFRGFMLMPLGRYMGSSAIFAMVLPYCMIHFGKPVLECFAAIIAGLVLGTLAMRTRSIWSGFMIHVSVALSMDILAMWQTHWVAAG